MQFSAQDYVHLVSLQMPKTMSEKNEIIFMSEYMAARLSEGSADFIKMTIGVKSFMQSDVAYILKSKYDELSLENARLGADLAKLRQQYLDKVQFMNDAADISRNNILQLHIENTKLKAELEKVKHENYILSTPISQEPLIAKDVPCTCDWQKVYPHLSVLCNPSTCKKTK